MTEYEARLATLQAASTLPEAPDVTRVEDLMVAIHTQPITGSRYVAAFVSKVGSLPAIMQSLDGQHTAFLYDALAWKLTTIPCGATGLRPHHK